MVRSNVQPPTVSVISLGCPKTLVDTERALGFLRALPACIVDRVEGSDVLVINTCAFIESASQESIDTILDGVRLKREGKIKRIIVTGCLPQRFRDQIVRELDEVDAFLGTDVYETLPAAVTRVLGGERVVTIRDTRTLYDALDGRELLTPKHFAYLKIAEGCNKRCTFCTIPFIRGLQRSRTIESLVREAETLAQKGVRELVLVSQNTTSFGIDRGKPELAAALRALARVDGIRWIRFLYNYPDELGDDCIQAVAEEEKLCPYIDLPLQHISDRILRRMARPMDRKGIEGLLRRIRRRIPDVAIRTQFIVGFPGEGEKEFKELSDFITAFRFERLGLFTFSVEEGTPSSRLADQVPEPVKKKRYDEAMLIQQEVARRVNSRLMGKTLTVLIDERSERDKDIYLGRTVWDAPEVDGQVFVHSGQRLKAGDFVKVKITDTLEYDLVGRLARDETARSLKRRSRLASRA